MEIEKLYKKIVELRENKSDKFQVLSKHIQSMPEDMFEYILNRLEKQIEIVKQYGIEIRPAIDPFVSSELGIYRRLDDLELGELLDYPECCVKSFSETARYGIDSEHLKEIESMKFDEETYAIILPSGFIPCSINCKKAIDNKLIGKIDKETYDKLLKLEEELFRELPHYHGAYDEYFEKIIVKSKKG